VPSPTPTPLRRATLAVASLLLVGFVLTALIRAWEGAAGASPLLHFGVAFESTRLPEITPALAAARPGGGYDGQFYAQMAVRPDPSDPALAKALDTPAYRLRRFLMPAAAALLGLADVRRTLDAFVLLHVAAWLAFAWVLHREWAGAGIDGWVRWVACVGGLGTLDSLRLGLPDLPCLLLVMVAVRALQAGRTGLGAVAAIAAPFAKETAVLGLVALFRNPLDRRAWGITAPALAACAVWSGLLLLLWPGSTGGVSGNLTWPGSAWATQLTGWISGLFDGEVTWRELSGIAVACGLAFQASWLLLRADTASPWARLGVLHAVLFWFVGPLVWEGPWAAARAGLPVTVAFCLTYPKGRAAWAVIVATNLPVIHGLYRLWLNA
jgi:hypothetical protein